MCVQSDDVAQFGRNVERTHCVQGFRAHHNRIRVYWMCVCVKQKQKAAAINQRLLMNVLQYDLCLLLLADGVDDSVKM